MKQMKKWLALWLAIGLLLGAAACGDEGGTTTDTPAPAPEPVMDGDVETLVAQGCYEAAYLKLDELDEAEAQAWREKLVFLPERVEIDATYSEEDNVTYLYDTDNLLTAVLYENSDRALAVLYQRDENGFLTQVGVTSQYDPGHIRVEDNALILPPGEDAEATTYTYQNNDAGRPVRMEHREFELLRGEIQYEYTPEGYLSKELRLTYAEDGTTTQEVWGTAYTYDDRGRKTSEQEHWLEGDKRLTCGYTWVYDDQDRITDYTYTDQYGRCRSHTVVYNALGKEEKTVYVDRNNVTHITDFTYDDRGNPVQEVATNQCDDKKTTTYTYDDRGNLLCQKVERLNGGEPYYTITTTYTYDEQDRQLTQVSVTEDHAEDTTREYRTANTYTATGFDQVLTDTDELGETQTFHYAYDTQGRVVKQDDYLYAYDRFGNTIQSGNMTYTYRLVYFPEGISPWLKNELQLKPEETDPMKFLQQKAYAEQLEEKPELPEYAAY